MRHIGVIIGSTRTVRVGKMITEWVLKSIQTTSENIEFEVIDLKEWNLPLIVEEPEIPAKGIYKFEKTREWSKKIKSKDGFIFVTPQYNWGYPASLKNAIDYLFKEWNDKPGIIISYGYRGGSKAALQLSQVLEGLRMKVIKTMPAIQISKEMSFDEKEYKEFYDAYSDIINKSIIEFRRTMMT
ncbi:NADPH-dependent FMN reductase-domain-containing protein [Pilaira anomala]|nr:NADPH-dependent FMN reductase-domain-containing protein [Pilaira anomala]